MTTEKPADPSPKYSPKLSPDEIAVLKAKIRKARGTRVVSTTNPEAARG